MKLHIDPEAPRDILDEKGELIATVHLNLPGMMDKGKYTQACALARQFAASGEVLAERADLFAQTQRDAAVIAELVAALRATVQEIDKWADGESGHVLQDSLDISRAALLAAESRAEAKCEWCDSGNVAPMSRIPSWPGRPLHEVGDGEYVACKRSSSTPAAAAESRAEAGREQAEAPITAEGLLDSLMDTCAEDSAGFWILNAAGNHSKGEPDACEESTACAYFWNQWLGHTTRQDIQDEFHARRAERLKREAAGPEVKS